MVNLDCLSALDCLQWLQTGARAAEALDCSQSSISRSARKCEKVFGITLKKRLAEWRVIGDTSLIQAERRVHQEHRWSHGQPLRLDSQDGLRQTYGQLPVEGWLKGKMDTPPGDQRLLELIRNRIIDAWLCSAAETPDSNDLTAIQLCAMPAFPVVKRGHPLAALGHRLTLDDVRRYPLLPRLHRSLSMSESADDSLGLKPHDPDRIPPSSLPMEDLPMEDLFVDIATPLRLSGCAADRVVLPLALPGKVGDALVVRREYADHPRTKALASELRRHLSAISRNLADVEILNPLGLPPSDLS